MSVLEMRLPLNYTTEEIRSVKTIEKLTIVQGLAVTLKNCLKDLRDRGLIFDISDEKGVENLTSSDAFYIGFDPTAANLQVGNLVPLVVTIHLARAGLRPIILFGGATGAIGDPSGKNEERKLLPREVIDSNIERQTAKVREIFQRRGISAEFVNNFDWTSNVSVIDFLRETGKHFTVNYMLAKEVVKARMAGEGISYTEFSYMLLQAFDFVHLYQSKNCRLQIGGSDQWGNMTAGLELIRRKIQKEAYVLSMPLITNSDGRKFGKSESGAIWLDASATSPYRFHQFWLNVDDRDALRYLRIFTTIDADEMKSLEAETAEHPEKRAAQKRLADEVCTLVHGEDATSDARNCAEVLFGGDITGLSDAQLEEIFSEVPSTEIPKDSLLGMTCTDLLVACKACQSKGEARRLISGGGAYVQSQRVNDAAQPAREFLSENSRLLVVRTGKKSYFLIRSINQ